MPHLISNHPAQLDELRAVLQFIRTTRGFDATGYCPSVLAARIRGRLLAAGVASADEYVRRLVETPAEADLLVEALTIKVSHFFRDPLAFEYLRERVLPVLLARTTVVPGEPGLRVWSAGCAHGEEPYSLAILLHELLQQNGSGLEPVLFATDVDAPALAQAQAAFYPAASLANVRHGLMAAAFLPAGAGFRVRPEVAARVRFSVHDMLDPRSAAPAESVFGSFDLILCRNLLIYFQPDYQAIICEKLFRALAPGGFLMLGSTENLPAPWSARFRRVTDCCSLFQKPPRKAGFDADRRADAEQPPTEPSPPCLRRLA
jgi:chemotaxis methyl-accepting protein methylase